MWRFAGKQQSKICLHLHKDAFESASPSLHLVFSTWDDTDELDEEGGLSNKQIMIKISGWECPFTAC